ncbi:hypothetical protein CDV31_011762 [Fusarium ambrosium]|uniref:Uncharacterized protein n=1 Tax=Fusarium ambrosium TaxID=131363 RepID=A0A428TEU5_9HYPO|nr:hypothetical protein CDV31_011762 [Fusarium ambrosium]
MNLNRQFPLLLCLLDIHYHVHDHPTPRPQMRVCHRISASITPYFTPGSFAAAISRHRPCSRRCLPQIPNCNDLCLSRPSTNPQGLDGIIGSRLGDLTTRHPSALTIIPPSSSKPSSRASAAGNNMSESTTPEDKSNKQPLPLPAPEEDTAAVRGDGVTALRVGESVRLDALGPLVVNADGSMGRVGNWAGMTEGEREATLRLLGRRNKQRLEALKAKKAEEEEEKQKGE